MTNENDDLHAWYQFNQDTIKALIEDGTDVNENHTIEHHFACNNFDRLEKAAVELFKLEYEVADAEEITLDDGGLLFCFDAVVERQLNLDTFNKDTELLIKIANKHNVHYDGWGTYFIQKDN